MRRPMGKCERDDTLLLSVDHGSSRSRDVHMTQMDVVGNHSIASKTGLLSMPRKSVQGGVRGHARPTHRRSIAGNTVRRRRHRHRVGRTAQKRREQHQLS
jgi:hypothetical protein